VNHETFIKHWFIISFACLEDLPTSVPPRQNQPPKVTTLSQNNGAPTDSIDKCPNEEETVNGIFDSDGCPDTIQDLLDLAVQDIDNFWRASFKAQGWVYTPPDVIKGYTRRNSVFTGCGRTIPNNAFYCILDNSIYYDVNFLEQKILRQNQNADFGRCGRTLV